MIEGQRDGLDCYVVACSCTVSVNLATKCFMILFDNSCGICRLGHMSVGISKQCVFIQSTAK